MMMIRSQDRKSLLPIKEMLIVQAAVIKQSDTVMEVGKSQIYNGESLIGAYASEARCLEILDDIQESFLYENPKVYEMPEK